LAAAVPKSFSINVATAQEIANADNKKIVSRKFINNDTRDFSMIKYLPLANKFEVYDYPALLVLYNNTAELILL
jgi:hypothetical protein